MLNNQRHFYRATFDALVTHAGWFVHSGRCAELWGARTIGPAVIETNNDLIIPSCVICHRHLYIERMERM